MKGLELAEKFYMTHGKPMLENQFSHVLPYIAVGLVGSGSECYGYDDELSKDHDFEPAFCIFLPSEEIVDRKTAFELEREYLKLPKNFLGTERKVLGTVGENRHGVIRTADFFISKTGSADGVLAAEQWLSLPEYSLFEAVNGRLFLDNFGEFSKIRERISYYPEDIRRKKLAGNLLLMAQSGQYNFERSLKRGESAAAQMAVFEFVKSAMNTLFLLNKQYMPYYKWSFRTLRDRIVGGAELSKKLEFLLTTDNNEVSAKQKSKTIESICAFVTEALQNQGLTNSDSAEMERQAYIINDKISDNKIRNMHILSGV